MFALAVLLAAPLAVAAGPLQKRISGFATYYDVQTGNAGACGSFLNNGDYVVAMNQVQYDQGMCGQTLTITANGKTAQARVMDLCPTGGGNCNYGDMDLSPGLFSFFADLGAGKIPIEWHFGGDAPQPQPQPQPTTTQAPPPPPPPTTTSTDVPPPTTTSSSQPAPSPSTSSSVPPPSSSSTSIDSASSSTTESEAPQQTDGSNNITTNTETGTANLSNLAMAVLNIGEMVRAAGGLGA